MTAMLLTIVTAMLLTIITNQNPETVQFLQLIELRQDSTNNDVAINFIALPDNLVLQNLCIDPTISFETFTNKFRNH